MKVNATAVRAVYAIFDPKRNSSMIMMLRGTMARKPLNNAIMTSSSPSSIAFAIG